MTSQGYKRRAQRTRDYSSLDHECKKCFGGISYDCWIQFTGPDIAAIKGKGNKQSC